MNKDIVYEALITHTKEWLDTAAFRLNSSINSKVVVFIFQDEVYAELNLKLSKLIYNDPDLRCKVNYGMHPNFSRTENCANQYYIYTFSKSDWENSELLINERTVDEVLFSNFENKTTFASTVTKEESYFIHNQYRGFLHRLPFCFFAENYEEEFKYLLNSTGEVSSEIALMDRYEAYFSNKDKEFDLTFSHDNQFKKVDWV